MNQPVKLIDGTTVTLPDTEANQAKYPQQGNQKAGLGFPICRILGITCLASGAIINAAMGPYKGKGSGEQALLRSLLGSFESGDVVLGDAFFATYFLLAELVRRGVDGVFQQHGARRLSTDFRKGTKLGERDHLITLPKPKIRPEWLTNEQYNAAPPSIVVRELDIGEKVLVTTLLCPKIATKAALKDLYKQRWNVELDFRNIKTTMGMVTLSCKTPVMAEKEMWVYFLAYNLIRHAMLRSALLADVLPRALSFKNSARLLLQQVSGRQLSITPENEAELLKLMGVQTVGKRAGRIEPRAVKRRPKPYPLLMQARTAARENVRKNGHPKKLK